MNLEPMTDKESGQSGSGVPPLNSSPMNLEPIIDKGEWRRRCRDFLKGLSETERDEASAGARDLLRRQAAWRSARAILFYAPLAGELDLTPLLEEARQAGKAVAMPRFAS